MNDQDTLLLIYLAFFSCTVLFSFLINGLLLRFVKTLGIRNSSETVIRWGSFSKPSIGGISFYILFIFSLLSYSILFKQSEVFSNIQVFGVLVSATLAFLMGLADDAYNTRPLLKALVQGLCGVVLILTGTYIKIFHDDIANYALTIFWIIGVMNSINMLDNMDAITTIVSGSIIFCCVYLQYLDDNLSNVFVFVSIGVIATLAGFLYYNWHPSKMYMGDTGSQFLGIFLGVMGILFLWNAPDTSGQVIQSKQFLVTLLAFIIPVIDTTTVVFNRLYKGRSPFIGGKDHTTHALFYSGVTERRIAVLFGSISLLSSFFIYLIIKVIEEWTYLHIVLFSFYFLAVFAILFSIARKKSR